MKLRPILEIVGATLLSFAIGAAVWGPDYIATLPNPAPAPMPIVIVTADDPAPVRELTAEDTAARFDRYEEAINPAPEPVAVPQAEIDAIALTLAGEEYEWESERKVVIAQIACNRVSVGMAPDIISALEDGFNGYKRQSRPVTDDDIEVATRVLTEWYSGGCEALSDTLFFTHVNGEFITAATYDEFVDKIEAAK